MDFKGLKLDAFQDGAIRAIEKGHSVIVSAPTGAGKTVIAEYAIEKALREGKEIIYTAPIKALSSQKYRDFSTDYRDKIGVMTGDVIINPDAPVLIMTTEIFRNIIFDTDGSRLANVGAVIFDEIHYINDIQRGTVWEESIIFAPQHISFICLSATIPNFNEFAEWMRSVRTKPIETIVETERPVPLETGIWVPEHGFRDMKFLANLEKQNLEERRRGDKRKKFDHTALIAWLRKEDRMPCIFFHFSRMGCQDLAMRFKGFNLMSTAERHQALDIFDELAERFSITERANTRVMRNLVKNGIAFHHAGILPALKEIIERLYTLSLIKILFTTETFAVGINMPAKCVVFESLMKYDGITFRYLTAREFQQMSGRAGRRGIDPVGYAYSIVNPTDFNMDGLRKTFSRDVEDIESQFSLSYSSILNLWGRFGEKIYDVCQRSFNNYKNIYQVELINTRAKQLSEEMKSLSEQNCIHGDFSKMDTFLTSRKEFFRVGDLLKKRGGKGKKPGSFELHEKLNDLKQVLSTIECSGCKRKKHCINIMKRIQAIRRELEGCGEEAIEMENMQRASIRSRLGLLRSLDYIDDNGLRPRGKIASQIFGYELQFTEMYYEGVFEGADEETINAIVSCIVFESRRSCPWRKLKDKKLQQAVDRADVIVHNLRALEMEARVPNQVKPLDTNLCNVLLAWCRGATFEQLRTNDLDDGDLVRNFRLVVDFIRQMKRAIHDPAFQDKLSRCVELIYRDVVDAEAQLSTQL